MCIRDSDLSNKPTINTYSAGTGLSLSGTTFNNTITNNNQLSNGANYTTFNSNQATNTSSSVTFGRVSINGGQSLRLATGGYDGDSDGKIQRHSTHMYLQTPDAGSWIFRNQSGNEYLNIQASNGALTSSNNITAFSDIRLKKDVKTIDNALDKVSKLRGVESVSYTHLTLPTILLV